MSFKIEVFPDTFSVSRYGTISGGINLKVDAVAFPNSDWGDSVPRILGWWIEETLHLISRTRERACCDFVDGPYSFDVLPEERGVWLVRLMSEGYERSECSTQGGPRALRIRKACVLEARVQSHEVIAELARASEATLAKCADNGWDTKDTQYLGRRVVELRSVADERT